MDRYYKITVSYDGVNESFYTSTSREVSKEFMPALLKDAIGIKKLEKVEEISPEEYFGHLERV